MEELGTLVFENINVVPGEKGAKYCVRDKDGIPVDFFEGITMKFYGGTVSREITDDEVRIIIKK